MKGKITAIGATALLMAMPALTFAAVNPKFAVFLNDIRQILNLILGLIFAIAAVAFVWSLVKFIIADSGESKDKAKETMKWGIIILIVASVFWGIVNVFAGALFEADETTQKALITPKA